MIVVLKLSGHILCLWCCNILCKIMDTFSLEEDDYGDLFIMQEVNNGDGKELVKNVDNQDDFLGLNPHDFQSPCESVVGAKLNECHYSDISDFEEEGDSKVKPVPSAR